MRKKIENRIAVELNQELKDDSVVEAVKTRLKQNGYTCNFANEVEVEVKVKEGVATLTGQAGNAIERHAAERVAFGTSGVHKVINKIVIEGVHHDQAECRPERTKRTSSNCSTRQLPLPD